MQYLETTSGRLSAKKGRITYPWRLVFLLPVVILAGCPEPTVGVVRGTIQVDGVPAKLGAITFIPVDGQSGTAGAAITDGKYIADDVPPGTHKVQIRVPKKVGEQKLYNTPDSPVQPIMAEVLPEKFNSKTELRLDVKLGENEKDYDLPSK